MKRPALLILALLYYCLLIPAAASDPVPDNTLFSISSSQDSSDRFSHPEPIDSAEHSSASNYCGHCINPTGTFFRHSEFSRRVPFSFRIIRAPPLA